ncbi:MAG: glyceraldehyde 3-phosphate dehydrogenase NAD-binding domain-containing protein [Janthinobacterium lividum]
MATIGLYGFGRIGRQFLRVGLGQNLFQPAAVADIWEEATLAALFAVDTNYGRWHEPVAGRAGQLSIGDREIPYLNSAKEVPD